MKCFKRNLRLRLNNRVATLEERWRVLPPYERSLNSEVSANGEVSFCRNILSSQNVPYRVWYVSSFIYYVLFWYSNETSSEREIPSEHRPGYIIIWYISNYIKLLLIIIQSISYWWNLIGCNGIVRPNSVTFIPTSVTKFHFKLQWNSGNGADLGII